MLLAAALVGLLALSACAAMPRPIPERLPGQRHRGRRQRRQRGRCASGSAASGADRRAAPPAAASGARRGARAPAGGRCPGRSSATSQNFEIADERVVERPLSRAADRGLRAGRGARAAAGGRRYPMPRPSRCRSWCCRCTAPRTVARLWPDGNPWWQAWADNLDTGAAAPPRPAARRPPGHGHGHGGSGRSPATRPRSPLWRHAMAARTCWWSIATPARFRATRPRRRRRRSSSRCAAVGIEQRQPARDRASPRPGETLEELMAEAVRRPAGFASTSVGRAPISCVTTRPGTMVVDIPIARLSDWVEISRGLQGLLGSRSGRRHDVCQRQRPRPDSLHRRSDSLRRGARAAWLGAIAGRGVMAVATDGRKSAAEARRRARRRHSF